MVKTGAYFHIPFCRRRCGYCDFNTFVGLSHLMPNYVKSLCREMELVRSQMEIPPIIDTVFFGGGTPSLLPIQAFSEILKNLKELFTVLPEVEITIEANPGTVSEEYIYNLAQMGFNRISFGMQSANLQDLKILHRQHRFEDVANAVTWSHQAGIRHINLDLIFGIPGQTVSSWSRTLELASAFQIDHLSLYSLIIEEGTPFKSWYDRGLLPEINDEVVAEMYELAEDLLAEKGFEQYEISNWARKNGNGSDSRCQHNLHTWQYHPYLGFGAGASGFWQDTRTTNVQLIPAYIERVRGGAFPWPAAETTINLDLWEQMQETLMIGLRLTEDGVSDLNFQQNFKHSFFDLFAKQINRLLKNGLVEALEGKEDRLRLTRKGRLLGNQVFLEFVGNKKPSSLG